MTSKSIIVKDKEVRIITGAVEDFICLTDIAKWKNPDANAVIANWLRNRNVLEYLGLWEQLYNPDFKPLEFEGFRKEAGLHAFTLSPQKWISATNAIGLVCKSGRYGGTYAHKDIAFHFADDGAGICRGEQATEISQILRTRISSTNYSTRNRSGWTATPYEAAARKQNQTSLILLHSPCTLFFVLRTQDGDKAGALRGGV